MKMASYVVLLSCSLVCFLGSVDSLQPACSSVRTKYQAQGLLQSDVPVKAMSDSSLEVCPSSSSGCCTKRMEDSFAGLARTQFEKALTANTDDLKNTFVNNGKEFDEFFHELIKNSEKDLNTMFLKTYGIFYKQHSQVFIDLFVSLNQYYNGKNLDLSQVMNNFFANLMREMFQLMNTKYKFTKSYLDCVTEYMDDLKPFGDIKQKLSVQVKRAFVAARTFVHGLKVGHSVLRQLQAVTASKACVKRITKLSYCSWCQGKTDLKPCDAFCSDSYKMCLSDMKDLNLAWENYVTALHDLSGKLEGPFSIENVIDPIGVKISFAIMNFQENHINVASKIFAGCGTPLLKTKTKRSSDNDFFIDEPGKVRRQVLQSGKDATPTTAAVTNLGRLTRKFRDEIKIAKGFWPRLPAKICATPTSAPDSGNCWNGTAVGRYTSPRDADNNIVSSLSPSSAIIEQQIAILKTMTQRLKSALGGEDVNVIGNGDGEGSGDESSGSGSGSGSGKNEINTGETTIPPTTNGNEIDEDDNMLGGGVSDKGGNTLGKKDGRSAGNTLTRMNGLFLTALVIVIVTLGW